MQGDLAWDTDWNTDQDTEDGAPPPSYWEGLYGQLKREDCEDDLPEIEVRVFN